MKTARIIFVSAIYAALLGLGGCGFTPIYASSDNENAPTAMDMNNIAIDVVPDRHSTDSSYARNDQILRNDLIDMMYGAERPEKPRYRLSIHIHYDEQDLAIQYNATSTRELLDMYADYTLQDTMDANGNLLVTPRKIISGTAHSVTSFELLDAMYATVAARQDAHARTLQECAQQIVNRVSLYFSERPDTPSPATK